jgi:hypothetical protein
MNKLIRFFSILSLAVICGAAAANAQSVTKVDAEIPFAFSVGDTTLAPGKYDIGVTAASAGTATVRISQKDGSGTWTVLGLLNGAAAQGKAGLVFDRYGDQRVLRQIILSHNGVALASNGSRKLRLARGIISKPATETVGSN